MTGLTKQSSGLPSMQNLNDLMVRIDESASLVEAKTLADMANVLKAAMNVSDVSHELQFEAAAVRIRAEHKLGVLLLETVERGRHNKNKLKDIGITPHRSSRAQKLANLTLDELHRYFTVIKGSKRDLSLNGALKSVNAKSEKQRTSIADVYTSPPIDVQLTRELLGDVSDEVVEIVHKAIKRALSGLSNRYAFVYYKRTGINDDGSQGEQWSFSKIGNQCGWSREYTENIYYRASNAVNESIASAALNHLKNLLVIIANQQSSMTSSLHG